MPHVMYMYMPPIVFITINSYWLGMSLYYNFVGWKYSYTQHILLNTKLCIMFSI